MAQFDDCSFGRIVIDGQEEYADVIRLPNRTVSHWRRRQGYELVIDDLAEALSELPERLLIGTGAGPDAPRPRGGRRPRGPRRRVEVLPTPQAVRRYRELDPKRTAAALHLTCREA